ncbi:MAG: GNAT family N-acetyltransferase [Bacillaceae bacterium]
MFKRVENKGDLELFEQIWADFCEESGILFLNYCNQSDKYLVLDDKNHAIGTVEIGTYDKHYSNVEKMFPFSQSKEVLALHDKKICEVSKLTIDKQYRGKGFFKRLIALLAIHAVENEVDWYIGVANLRVLKYVKTLGFEIYSIGEPVALSNRIQGIPFLLNAKHGVTHASSFSDFRYLLEAYRVQSG